jgi:hypothetical protein
MPKPMRNLGKMNVFPIFATAKAPSVASSYHSINGKSLAKH